MNDFIRAWLNSCARAAWLWTLWFDQAEAAMDDQSERERAMIDEWCRSACDAAVYYGLVQLPWRPSEQVIGTLHSFYPTGMTPAEGAQALFATRH